MLVPIAHGLPKVTHADAQFRAIEDPLYLGGAFTFALAMKRKPVPTQRAAPARESTHQRRT